MTTHGGSAAEQPAAREAVHWRDAADLVDDLLVVLDAGGVIRSANPAADAFFRRSSGEGSTIRLADRIHPDDREALAIGSVAPGDPSLRPTASAFLRIAGPDGEHQPFSCRYRRTPDGSGLFVCRPVPAPTVEVDELRRLDAILHAAALGTWEWNVATGHVHFNERWAEMLGYDQAELEPTVTTWERSVHPDDLEQVLRAVQDHLEGRTPIYVTKHRLRHKDGHWVWVDDVGQVLLRDPDGNPLFAAGVHFDVTQQMATEEEARRNLVLFRTLMDSQPLGVSIAAPDGRIIEANPAAAEILGLARARHVVLDVASEEWLLYRADGSRMPVDEIPAIRALREGRSIAAVEMGVERPDGTVVWLSTSAAPIDHPEFGALVTYVDISSLKESEMRYRAILSSVDAAIYTLDLDGTVTSLVGHTLEGFPADVLLGRLFEVVLPSEVIPHHIDARNVALAGERASYEWSHDGIHYEAVLTPLHDGMGQLTGVVGVLRDVSGRVLLERARLSLSQQMISLQHAQTLATMAAGVAHDINNNLTALLAAAEFAQNTVAPDSEASGHIDTVIEIAGCAADLAAQMLAYAGKGQYQMASADVNLLIADHLSLLQASARPAEIEFLPGGHLPAVSADPSQIQQAVHNLVKNAAEAMASQPGKVILSTSCQSAADVPASWRGNKAPLRPIDYVDVAVQDSGEGIPDANTSQIFEPFFSTKFLGRGLGLAAAEGIMRTHNGLILFDSTPGRGSTFHLLFPALT